MPSRRSAAMLAAVASLLLLSAPLPARTAPALGTTGFILDGNRIYARVTFVGARGALQHGLAYVDTGAPRATASQSLLTALHAHRTSALKMHIGAFPLSISRTLIDVTPGTTPHELGGLPIEATLPASVLSHYEVIVDYGRRQLTVATPGAIKPAGIPTRFRINPRTGIFAVDASIAGKSYPVTIDLGSAWTWFRQPQVKSWLAANRGWARAVGAVGASNMMMVGDLEASGLLARLPSVRVGAVELSDVDLLGPGPSKAFPFDLFDWYSRKNPAPVLGWIGGNVLKQFRLTIDYPRRTLYWQRERGPDLGELDQVGLTLRREGTSYVVAGIALKDGRKTVDGVHTADILVAVDGTPLSTSLGAVFQALHGRPGERRMLGLRRGNRTLTIPTTVTAF